jgi:hypothetical protein
VIEVPPSFLFDLDPTAAARTDIEFNLGMENRVLPPQRLLHPSEYEPAAANISGTAVSYASL